MSRLELISKVLQATPGAIRFRNISLLMVILGAVGAGLGFAGAHPKAGWAALLTGTVVILGLGMVGALLSAMFEITGARWGRPYRRLAEAGVMLMPVGLVSMLVLMAGGNSYLPWVIEHPHVGGKAIWLTRGFWDLRVLGALFLAYGVALYFIYFSIRRDFCISEVRERFVGGIGKFFGRGITDADAEALRCQRKLTVLAPFVAVIYVLMFSLLGFDLIMALDPEWFSTLFGAWYFIGNLFCGLALLSIISVVFRARLNLSDFISAKHQSDLATLLLAFCLLNADFFWNQYLTIWYANIPEETAYLIERTADTSLPWRSLSFISIFTFFAFPFLALLFRKVKTNSVLLTVVSLSAVFGIFITRFIEIAPALLHVEPSSGLGVLVIPLASALLVFVGLLGAGLFLYSWFLTKVPIFPVGDEIFIQEVS